MTTFRTRLLGFPICLVLVALMGTTLVPERAHAQWIVFDPTAFSKDFALDHVGWVLAKGAIQVMTRSTVNWINSGFKGSPAFTTDLNRYMLQVGDAMANRFIEDLDQGLTIRTPYNDQISEAIRVGYFLSTGGTPYYVKNPYTLDQYSNNPEAFIAGEFGYGGFNAWFSTAMNPQNNPYGAYQLALSELNSRVNGVQGARAKELDWGNGFMSFRDCGVDDNLSSDGLIDLRDKEHCFGSIKTPGTVIAGNLNKSLGLGADSLVTADEIDEILGALFTQLVSQVFSPGGLLGVSEKQQGGGRSFLERATDEGQYQATTTTQTGQTQQQLPRR